MPTSMSWCTRALSAAAPLDLEMRARRQWWQLLLMMAPMPAALAMGVIMAGDGITASYAGSEMSSAGSMEPLQSYDFVQREWL